MRQIVRGRAWAVLMRAAIRALGYVSTIVLARLLTPDDYGIIALSMLFVGLLESMSWLGFDVALMQHQKASEAKHHTMWTMSFLRGLLLTTVVAAAAPL